MVITNLRNLLSRS